MWYLWQDLRTPQAVQDAALWLPGYRASGPALEIPSIDNNASGITYDPSRDSLWVVGNRPSALFEFDTRMQLKRRIALHNFQDVEGIAYLASGRFALTDERQQKLVLAPIDDDTEAMDRDQLRLLEVKLGERGNKGLEGVAYNATDDILFAVRESSPRKLVQIEGLFSERQYLSINTAPAIDVEALYLDDLSGLHFDEASGHLLILSHESMMLAEVDLAGNRISYMDLEAGFNNQAVDIPQAEGVTVDAGGTLYIVSEPNLLFRYQTGG